MLLNELADEAGTGYAINARHEGKYFKISPKNIGEISIWMIAVWDTRVPTTTTLRTT